MMERIANSLEHCQLKMAGDKRGHFAGYASVFNGDDSYGDTILPGAFKQSLDSGRDIKMFFNHDSHDVPPADILVAKEDTTGLWIEGAMDFNHHLGESIYSAMARKAVDGFSIGFKMTKNDWEPKDPDDDQGSTYWAGNRNIHNVELMEVSIVTWPADDSARISELKSGIAQLATERDFERFLRDVGGFSRSMATDFMGQLLTQSQGELGQVRQRIEQQAEAVKYAEAGEACKSLRQRLLAL